MIRGVAVVAVAACLLVPFEVRAERNAVLVTSTDCPIAELSILDIRKAYLGIGVEIAGKPAQPYRQSSDVTLNNVFLQYVVAMSRKSYERRLLSMLLKYGTRRPLDFDTSKQMSNALKENVCSIGIMWRTTLRAEDGLKELKLLWRGD